MSIFKRAIAGFTDALNSTVGTLTNEFKRFVDKGTLRALIASALKHAWADGELEAPERTKSFQIFLKHPLVAHFKPGDIKSVWDELGGLYEMDKSIGDEQAEQWLDGALNSDVVVKRGAIVIGMAVSGADGVYEAPEVETTRDLCRKYGLNPSEFKPLVVAAEANGISL